MCFLITQKLIKGSFGDAGWKPPNLKLRPDFTRVSKGIKCRSAPAQDDASVPEGTHSDGAERGTAGSGMALPARSQPGTTAELKATLCCCTTRITVLLHSI